jgi:hypothetical protein
MTAPVALTFPFHLRHLSVAGCVTRHIRKVYGLLSLMGPPMRLLLVSLLISVGALLVVAAGTARHIWLQRAKLRRMPAAAFESAEEYDLELEH